jgi:hypothetical protein
MWKRCNDILFVPDEMYTVLVVLFDKIGVHG